MTASTARHPWLTLTLLVIIGLVFEALWLGIGTLTAWVTDVPAYTAATAPAQQPPWAWLHGGFEAWLGPDRSVLPLPPTSVPAQVTFIMGLAVAGGLYVAMLGLLKFSKLAGRTALCLVVGLALVFDATLCRVPGLLSGDAILYATFGRLAGVQQLDPYVVSNAWPAFTQTDATWWWFVPSPYGPVWSQLSAALATLTDAAGPLVQVDAFRGLAACALVISLGLIWWLTPRLVPGTTPNDRLLAVALVAWNPLVLFETGQGHNDTFIGCLLLLALVPLALTRRSPAGWSWLAAFVVLTLDTLVKYLTVVACGFLLAVRLRRSPAGWARAAAAALLVGVVCAVTLLAVVPFRESTGVWQAMLNATGGGQRYADSVVDLPTFPIVARFLDRLNEHTPQSMAQVRLAEAIVVRGLAAGYVAWEMWRIWRRPDDDAAADVPAAIGATVRVSLVVIVFVLTQTLDYYFIAPLVLAAVLGWRNTWTRVTIAISVLFLPTFFLRRMDLEPVPNVFLIGALLLPLAVGLLASVGGQLRTVGGRRAREAEVVGTRAQRLS